MAFPVLVAGAGPVGLTLACELERLGVERRVADAAVDRAAISRATDLHARSLEVWDALGAGEAIAGAGVAIAGVPLLSGGREVARLDFAGELPSAGPPGVEVLADAALRADGRLGVAAAAALRAG